MQEMLAYVGKQSLNKLRTLRIVEWIKDEPIKKSWLSYRILKFLGVVILLKDLAYDEVQIDVRWLPFKVWLNLIHLPRDNKFRTFLAVLLAIHSISIELKAVENVCWPEDILTLFNLLWIFKLMDRVIFFFEIFFPELGNFSLLLLSSWRPS